LNPNLEKFKKFNELGVQRKHALNKKRIEKFNYNHNWEIDSSERVYTLRDYKCCYITIVKKNDMFEPRINGSSVSDFPDTIVLSRLYNTLDEAKKSAFMFVDTVTQKNK